MLPRILSVGTAVPAHELTAARLRELAPTVYGGHDAARLLAIVENSGIARRFLVEPPERIVLRRGFGEKNDVYIEHSRTLGLAAAERALAAAGIGAGEIDFVITTSCTGFAIPSLDAWLMNRLAIPGTARRLPITELGCAAGAAGIARAADLVRAYPGAAALVVAVEIPSLTFQPQDDGMANVVSSFLFGDGAAAVVVADRPARAGAEIVASRSVLFPETLDYMGFRLRDSGFHIVLAPAIPFLVRKRFAAELAPVLDAAGVTAADVKFLVLHPGGARVLDALAEALGVAPARLDASRAVLGQYGNLSSASVLFVYEEALAREAPAAGDLGIIAAFGPGFSAEMVLFRWSEGVKLDERSLSSHSTLGVGYNINRTAGQARPPRESER